MSDVVILTGVFDEMPSNSRPAEGFKVRDLENPLPEKGRHLRTMGAYKIADHLRKNGISVQVIDYIHMMNTETMLTYIRKFLPKDKNRPSILGLSTTFFHIDEKTKLMPDLVLEAVKTIKEEYPLLKVVAGGSRSHQLNRKLNYVDWSIYSYSEDIALELFNGILRKTPMPFEFKIEKKLYKENSVFDITEDCLKFIKEDCVRPNEALPLEISRGCIFKCTFCRFPYIGKKKNDYIKCTDRIREELIYNWENFGTTNYYLMDDTFNETPQKVKEFRDMTLTLPFKLNWVSYLRADLIERFPETAVWLKESGCRGAFFGIESFHPEASKLIGKAWSGKKAKEFLIDLKQNIWKDDVNITVSLIIGIPPEDLDHALETNAWLYENDIDFWGWHLLALNDNDRRKDMSDMEKDPAKYGITITGSDWHNGYVSRDEAAQWFKVLKKDTHGKLNRVSNWRTVEYGQWYDLEMVLRTDLDDYIDTLPEKKRNWFNMYIDLLNQLPESE